MVFEDKRLGYGVYNPRIRKGAKGYYSNYLKSIVEKVGNPHRHPAILCRQLVEDPKTDANLLHPYIIYNPHTRENEGWQFFYVLEEAEEVNNAMLGGDGDLQKAVAEAVQVAAVAVAIVQHLAEEKEEK